MASYSKLVSSTELLVWLNDKLSNHENVNGAKNVTVNNEFSWLSSCERNSVSFAGGHCDASGEVCAYRETVRLCRILVTDNDADKLTLLHPDNRPRVRWCSVTYAVVES